jgi:hypothetical protein
MEKLVRPMSSMSARATVAMYPRLSAALVGAADRAPPGRALLVMVKLVQDLGQPPGECLGMLLIPYVLRETQRRHA